ncbi:hypothetical protein P8C59_004443 [Phyllachora maydis]|uniref:BTB domain-containing protein n=1 Tax=Phyllachora maydis TaxID=1825666 RepID=A0AAD9MCG1_9PEZI|nr:hypothetical protein P8C59_004443 [Phyllachora maydis]
MFDLELTSPRVIQNFPWTLPSHLRPTFWHRRVAIRHHAKKQGVEFAGNLELIRSGEFSDASISCKDRTWKIHRCILEPRSAWFAKALSGKFEEGKSKHVTIEESEPDILNLVLEYIYCGPDSDYIETIQHDATLDVHFGTLVDMLELLEFFQLTPLQGPILKCLDMMLESIYQDVQLHFRNAAGKSNFVSLLDFKSIDTIRQLCDSAPTIFN